MTTIEIPPQDSSTWLGDKIYDAEEPRLQQAQRMMQMGCMAGSIAHDLNNLLTVIEGSAGLAAEALPQDHAAQPDLSAIMQASRRSSAMIRQILGFIRQQPTTPFPLHVGDVLAGIDLLTERIAGHQISMSVDIAQDLWLTLAVHSQIEQILINLMTNARDAMPQGGRMIVRARNHSEPAPDGLPPREYVLLEVSDTGEGVSPEARPQLFTPFYTTKSPGKGVGLGLIICGSIVARLGGRIELESEPGQGSTFRVLLPRAAI